MDIQAKLDELLEGNPELQKYVTAVWYVREGTTPPLGTTHTVKLSSVMSAERELTIGLVVKPEYAIALDALLAMIATQPPKA